MHEQVPMLPSRPLRAALRLVLVFLVPIGLVHTASLVKYSQHSAQPSWADQLMLDGTPHEGVLGTAQDVDYFRIEVAELSEAVIHSKSEVGIRAALFGSEGREIATDAGGGGRDMRIAAVLNAGNYYLRIEQQSFGSRTSASEKYTLQAFGSVLSPIRLTLDGSSKEGAIEPGENADYFRVEVTELSEAEIYTSGGLDTIGTVLDSEGREIVSNDDGGEGRNFRVTALLWPGEYFVRVTPWVSSSGNSETGSYNLHATGAPASIAQLPLDGSSKEGVIELGEDGDYYRIAVTELADAVFYTSGATDTIGALLDSEGREIVSDDDGGAAGNFRLSAILEAGEYYVKVAQWQRGALLTTPEAPPLRAAPEPEPGSYSLHAEGAPLSPTQLMLDGTPREGFIDSGHNADYFRFEVTELTELAIHTSGGLDTVGALLDSEGREIVSDDDGGLSGNFRISALLWPGDYFVRVTPWVKFSGQFDSGSYSLHAEGKSASPVDLALSGPPQNGVIEAGEAQDYFRIEVAEPTAAMFYTTGDLDTAGALVGANGNEYAFNDDGGEQFINFRIAVVLLRPGEYLLRVYSSSGSAGSYTLHAEGPHGGP